MALRVLVVDDSTINLRLVQHLLEERGFEVECVTGGAEALAAVERRRPDLIILDVVMPGMSGIEVLDRLRSNPAQAEIPVIMLTAMTGDRDVLAGYQSGADYFITKPLVPHQLLYGIGLVLGREIPGTVASSSPAASRPSRARSSPRRP